MCQSTIHTAISKSTFILLLGLLTGIMSNSAKAQYQGIQVRDSICANITYVSSLPSNYPGENFSYQWLPNSMMNNNTLANPIFVFPFGFSQLSYLRIRTGNTGVYYDTLRIVFQDNYPFDVNPFVTYCPNGVNTLFLNGTQGVVATLPVSVIAIAGQPNTYNLNLAEPVSQFSIQLINQNGCPTFPYIFQVTISDTILPSTPIIADQFCLGSPTVALLPGVPDNGTYSINGLPASQVDPQQLGVGSHFITYQASQNGCIYRVLDTISVIDVNNIQIAEIAALCTEDEPILLSNYATPSGGTFSLNGSSITAFNPFNRAPGSYTISYEIVVSDNCSAIKDFIVSVKPSPPKPNIVTFTGFNEFCFGDSLLVAVNPYPNILWNTGDTVPGFLVYNTQTLQVQYTNGLGCKQFDTLVVIELDPILLNLSSPTYPNGLEISTFGASDGSILASSGGGNPPFTFVLNGNNVFTSPVNQLTAGTYTISVNDSRGCRTSDTITLNQPNEIPIDPEKLNNIFGIPNSFTPNGDGFNDFWMFKNLDLAPQNKLSVFNRWGQLVYSANGYNNNWNGEVNGRVTEAVYFYVFENLSDNKAYKGFVNTVLK